MTDKKLIQKNWSSWHHQLHKEILTKKNINSQRIQYFNKCFGGSRLNGLINPN